MKTSAAILLAAGTFGGGLLAGRLLFQGDAVCKIEPPPAPAARAAHVTTPEPPPDLEGPDSRLVIMPPSPPQAEAAPPALEQAVQVSPPKLDPKLVSFPEASLAEKRAKRRAIQDYLDYRAHSVIGHRFEDGQFEHVVDEHEWKGGDTDWERFMIYGLRQRPSVPGWDRTILPRDQYPELYAYKDETLRLDKLIRAAEEELAHQESAAPR